MPQELEKTSGVSVAGSYDDLVKILKGVSSSGKNLGDTAENIAKKIMIGEGGGQSHSLVIDLLKFPIKETSVGKKIHPAIDNVQKNIANIDMKAGKKIYDALNKTNTKIGKKLSNQFVANQNVKIKKPSGLLDEILEIPVAGLSNPFTKTKNAVLPVAGAFAIDNELNKDKQKGGDIVRTAYTREEIIEKIATAIDGKDYCIKQNPKSNNTKTVDKNMIIKKASETLKVAAQKIRELEVCNEKLALENQRLYLENIERKRLEEATKLAHEMNEKGLIKKADIESKISDFFSMDEQSFSMFKSAIENICYNNYQKDGIDSLTFVVDNNNINYRKTLADSINEAANEIR